MYTAETYIMGRALHFADEMNISTGRKRVVFILKLKRSQRIKFKNHVSVCYTELRP